MKKWLTLFLCLALMLGLAACAAVGVGENSDQPLKDSNLQQNNQNTGTVNSVDLTLKYDDRYTFPDAIESVENLTVTSKKAGTDTLDTAGLGRPPD